MISGTIQRSYIWLAAVPVAILGAIIGSIAYSLWFTIAAHGVAGINSGFLIAFGIALLCVGTVGWRIVNLRRTVHTFTSDGQTIRFRTFGSRDEIRELVQIARLESRHHTSSRSYRLVFGDGDVLVLVGGLQNAAEL